jgi:hypothetical protein
MSRIELIAPQRIFDLGGALRQTAASEKIKQYERTQAEPQRNLPSSEDPKGCENFLARQADGTGHPKSVDDLEVRPKCCKISFFRKK